MSKTKMSKNEIEQKIRDLKTKLSCQESDIGDWKIAKCIEYSTLGMESPYDLQELHKQRQVIRECSEGRGVEVPGGAKGVWLDTPMIEILGGEGTIEKRIPAMFRMYMNYGIDMRKVPIVIYPTLHYQNGGLEITGDGFTKEIPGEGDNYLVDVYRFVMDISDEDLKLQTEETDGYMFATKEQIEAFAAEGKFLHYDSIKQAFEF